MYDDPESNDRAVVAALEELSGKRGVPMAQLAMAWVLSKPEVTSPIVGVSKSSHLEDAVAAVGLKLTAEEIAALEAPYQPRVVTGF
jgi:aryl-alcohol dehydrogenase (NADP+)